MSNADVTGQARNALPSVPYFSGLDATSLEAVAQAAVRQEYKKDEVVSLRGEPCFGLYVVEEGWFKAVRISPEGREQALRFVGPGEVFNEVGVSAGTSNPATVVALERGSVWLIHEDTMLQLLDGHPRLVRSVVEDLARRVLHLASLVEDLSLRTVEARLARLLLERADEAALNRRRWATQAEMATRLGTVLEVLNRALHRLVDEGLIKVERHQIRILDRKGLRAKAMIE
ncbi:MAG: Crp/Fnr family transcriptional regulator [Chloroflexota bacterium]|nr:Crp/Fnr family transcriptional regulator [Chloroflexota bacterium]